MPYEIVEGAQCLLDGRKWVDLMQLIEIKVIRLQPLQAALDGSHDVAACATLEPSGLVHSHAEFGRKHDFVALAAFEHLAHRGLGTAAV